MGNDVEMILQGDVGVGVQGVEGSQAVNNSDFAITEFQHLENLLLVHGRWTYQRIATSVCYFFYKNMAFTMCVFWFSCFSACSGQLFFEAWSAASYNVFFTSLPVLVFGLMNQDMSQDIARSVPRLYEPGQKSELFNYRVFIWWVCEALYASIIMFYFGYGALMEGQVWTNGRTYEQWIASTAVYTGCVLAMTLRISFETSYYTWITHLCYWGSVAAWFLYNFLTCCTGVLGLFGLIPGYSYQYWVIIQLLSSGAFWLYILLIPVLVCLPVYAYRAGQALYFPNLNDKARTSSWWRSLVLDGLMDPDPPAMKKLLAEHGVQLTQSEIDNVQKKANPVVSGGTGAHKAMQSVPHSSHDGDGKINTAIWSGRMSLGKMAIRKAARRVMLDTFKRSEVERKLALKDKLQGKASRFANVASWAHQDMRASAADAADKDHRESLRSSAEATAAEEKQDESPSSVPEV